MKYDQRVLLMSFYDVIDKIRIRPAMYFGSCSITALRSFLAGILFVTEEDMDPPFGDFHDWVACKYNWYESTAGWANMILQENRWDEEKALKCFFELLDEFKACNGKMPERPARPVQRYQQRQP